LAPLLSIAALCIVDGWAHAPLLSIAALCIVDGWAHAPLLSIAALCIVDGADHRISLTVKTGRSALVLVGRPLRRCRGRRHQ
jgi:hypothetical protein